MDRAIVGHSQRLWSWLRFGAGRQLLRPAQGADGGGLEPLEPLEHAALLRAGAGQAQPAPRLGRLKAVLLFFFGVGGRSACSFLFHAAPARLAHEFLPGRLVVLLIPFEPRARKPHDLSRLSPARVSRLQATCFFAFEAVGGALPMPQLKVMSLPFVWLLAWLMAKGQDADNLARS